VAGEVARKFLGEWGGSAVALAAMVSMFAAINGSILAGSRVPFAMARDGVFFPALARVHPRYHSPHVAVIVQSVLAALMALTGQYDELFTYVIFASWIYYGLTGAAVFMLRRKHPEWPRPYRTWGYPVLPALFVAISGALVVLTLREQAWWRSLLGLGIIGLGVPAYLIGRRYARKAGLAAVVLVCVCSVGAPTCRSATLAGLEAGAPRSELLLFTLNEEAALDSLRQHVARGTLLSPQWFAVSGGGALAGAPNAVLLEAARSRGVAVAPSVINRDFSAQAAAAVLRSAPARSRLVSQLTAKARQYGFRGYVIDFENLPADPATRKRFTQWMGELRAAFSPARLSLIVALPPPTTRQRQALDYQAIGRLADRVVLMAYDQHGRFNDPGPIAGYEWVETALADIGALIPAHKLLLGIAFYHRNWGGAEATSGTYNEAVALGRENRAEWRWHPEYRAHWFDFMERGRRHTVWIEDAASVAEKLALARRFGLAGVAGWRLGQEDPRVWLLLQEFQR